MKSRLAVLASLMLASFALSAPAIAGGVGLSATRIIYNETASQASLPITNSDAHERYLVQAWIEDSKGRKSADFVVTPPLFSSSPKSENTLRIVYLGKPLPKDREVVYWMNVKAIPAINPEAIKDKNTLQLAILSRIKLFMRPQSLGMKEIDAMTHLRFHQAGGQLTLSNPTPYYQTLVNLTIGDKKLPNSMVDPMGQLTIPVPAGAVGDVRFQIVNDYGALSAQQTGQFN
ncbi:fimbria/pilus periplasmic chaperone [Serratia liquefaciens]|uniref:fimbria/pilus periplasmic chaperone n=1 Tax=Serratia liquefaciens TaxID=614 RepID=UPI003822FCC0